MNATTSLRPGEIGVEAGAAVRAMLSRAVGGEPVAGYLTGQPLAWTTVQQGGWDMLGAPEAAGGADATLRDLVEVALVWGEFIVPLPLMPTILARRWSAAARESEGAVTVSVATRATEGRGVAVFGAEDGTAVLTAVGTGGRLVSAADPVPDSYAPSLRPVETTTVTDWTGEAAAELAVVWAAEAAGCAARMLRDAIAYAKQRHQFGQPIGRFQAIKHQLADAHILVEQAETAVIWGSLELGSARRAAELAFDASQRVIETSVQVHGGLGFTWEMGLHMFLRHVGSLRELTAGLPA